MGPADKVTLQIPLEEENFLQDFCTGAAIEDQR
jgi:hypothetical protein